MCAPQLSLLLIRTLVQLMTILTLNSDAWKAWIRAPRSVALQYFKGRRPECSHEFAFVHTARQASHHGCRVNRSTDLWSEVLPRHNCCSNGKMDVPQKHAWYSSCWLSEKRFRAKQSWQIDAWVQYSAVLWHKTTALQQASWAQDIPYIEQNLSCIWYPWSLLEVILVCWHKQ